MLEPPALPSGHLCAGCGTELAAGLLSCPACGQLTHAEELSRLAAAAQSAESPVAALAAWREMLPLLPAGARQREAITARIDALGREVDAAPGAAPTPLRPEKTTGRSWRGIAGGIGALALLLSKSKFLLVLLLTKGKLLLLGLTKASTLFSMLLSFGVYWSVWGWKFAAGFVLSIYVHEMGHVAMLRRFGVPASAPMFIPGVGALVRLKAPLSTPREDARVGLAGPIWGLGAAVAAWLIALGTGSPMFMAIARVGAWINLFNLLPVWQLDGSRAFRALTRPQRWTAAVSLLGAWFFVHEALLLGLCAVAVWRCFEREVAPEPDTRALVEYVYLVATLSALLTLPVRL